MLRAESLVKDVASPDDAIALDYDHRHRRRLRLESRGGRQFLLDLPSATLLRDGDVLLLDDGTTVRVEARPEPVADITAASRTELVRLAWHLGNRHLPVQVLDDRLRIRRDHVIADMLRGLGAEVSECEAAFHPEGGAYAHEH